MKSIKKKQESNISIHVDIAINNEKIAQWANKKGYKWQNFAYWKDGKEYQLKEIYQLFKEQKEGK